MWVKFLTIVSFFSLTGCQKMTAEDELQANKTIMEVSQNSLKNGFNEILLQQNVLSDGLKRCNTIDPVIIRSLLIDDLVAEGDSIFNRFIRTYPLLLHKKNYPPKIRRFIHVKRSYDFDIYAAITKKAHDYLEQLKTNHKMAKTDEDKAVALVQVSNMMICFNSKISLGLAGLDDELSSIAQDLMIEYIEDMGRSAKEELEKLNNL